MWQSVLKKVGFPTEEDYIRPRLSIGNTVYDHPFSTGHFTIQVDAQALSVIIKNPNGRIIWKSIHNYPFLASSVGQTTISSGEQSGIFHISEQEAATTVLQTITRIERTNKSTIKIYGGLGAKLVLPTHMNYVFTIKEVSNRQLEFSAEILMRDDSMKDFRRLVLTYESRAEEHFYGFGEQFSFVSLKGQKVPILVREQWSGRGIASGFSLKDTSLGVFGGFSSVDNFATYASIPQYITSDIRCMLIENTEYMSFDLTELDRVTVRLESDKMKGRILDGKTMLDLLTEYTSYVGRMLPLPDWTSHGIIAGIQGGKEKISQIVSRLSEYKVPLAAICVQDWTGQRQNEAEKGTAITQSWWNWESDDSLYPEWPDFVDSMNRKGVKVIAYINPFLSDVNEKRLRKRNFYLEANEKGYLVKKPESPLSDGKVLLMNLNADIKTGLLDLTNPNARVWFKQILHEIWDTNIAGMMVGFGEQLPYNSDEAALYSEESVSSYHNKYPMEWAALHKEVLEENNKDKDALCFFQSAYTKSPRNMNLLWTGSQNVTWDQHYGIKSTVIGMLSGGFSGLSVTHCDAGGCNSVQSNIPGLKMARTRELLYRWLELAALTPVFRTSEGIAPSINAQFYDNEESYLHLAHTAKLFVFLAEYIKTVLAEAYENGWPVLRHPVLYYPTDKIAQTLTYQQFFIGSCVMAVPVLTPSTTYVKAYFPKDSQGIKWRHIWSGKIFASDGTYKSVVAPIGQPAIFIKEPRSDDGLLSPLLNYATAYSHSNTSK
ncbi:glycosyl hydrolases family 31-domain-containing protein [Choanephora cucurbitarum]|nr:glycosyl hydrolases family 31-domain-containing protein [Choanephora cucurbitarum]